MIIPVDRPACYAQNRPKSTYQNDAIRPSYQLSTFDKLIKHDNPLIYSTVTVVEF